MKTLGPRRTIPTLLLVVVMAGCIAAVASAAPYDFNEDGRQELVVGLPWWHDPDKQSQADPGDDNVGAVVIFDGAKGDTLLGEPRVLSHRELGLTGSPANSYVGDGVASADFNGDGHADLAVGGYGLGERGAVAALYGPSPLGAPRGEVIDAPPGTNYFGLDLAAGDINGDGHDDLFGRTSEGYSDSAEPRSRTVGIPGSPDGLVEPGFVIPRDESAEYLGTGFGYAIGDVTGDGRADLVGVDPGVPFGEFGGEGPPTPGFVALFTGGETRMLKVGMHGGPRSVALGDVNGDGSQDLVAGVPVNRYVDQYFDDEKPPAGKVLIWPGPVSASRKPVAISQRTAGVPGSNEHGDEFGHSVSVARLDRDRYADIVIGAPGEDGERGRVTIIRGGPSWHRMNGNRTIDQGTRGVPGKATKDSRFGATLTLLDLNGDSRRDLVVASTGEDRESPGSEGAGAVTAFSGAKGGRFRTRAARRFRIASLGQRPILGLGMTLGRVGGS